jgi:hypothetical protein
MGDKRPTTPYPNKRVRLQGKATSGKKQQKHIHLDFLLPAFVEVEATTEDPDHKGRESKGP